MTDSLHDKTNKPTNQKRRKVLKTAGVAGGVIAAAQWHKPALDTILLPAHAQTSVAGPTTLVGSSAGVPSVVNANQDNSVDSIASRVLDGIIPAANAGIASAGGNPISIWRGLVNDVEDYQHCVNLTLPAGETSPTSVDVSLEGPTIYYDFSSYDSAGGYYFDQSVNFSGMSTATPLVENGGNFEFSTIINGIEISGSIDSTLSSASGALILQSRIGDVDFAGGNNDQDAGYGGAFRSDGAGESGYGAYWASGEGSSCTVGAGYSGAQITPNN